MDSQNKFILTIYIIEDLTTAANYNCGRNANSQNTILTQSLPIFG